ncbi:MAG: glycosyltransferase family 39 protein [Patescibacteria group bacterium]
MNGKWKTIFLLVAITLLTIFLRFYSIKSTPPGLYPDEAMNGNNAIEALRAGQFKIFYPENNGREGLFINIQAMFLKLFGAPNINPEPWMLRIPSAIFGTLTVLGLYFLGRQLFNNRAIALLASFLLATSFWHINFSRIGFRAIMAPFFLTWAIYFILLSFRKINKLTPMPYSSFLPIIGGVVYGLGFYSYIAYRATPLIIALILILFLREHGLHKTLKIGALFTIAAIIVAVPLGMFFLENPGDFLGRTSQISIFNSPTPIRDLAINILKTGGMFNILGDYNWRHNISGSPQLFWPVGILFLFGILTGIKNIYKNHEDKIVSIILFSWLIVTALPVVVSNEGLPHALRAIIMIPPVFVLSALGGVNLYKWIRTKKIPGKLISAGCWLLFVCLATQSFYSYFIVWAKNLNTKGAFAQNYVDMGHLLNRLPEDSNKYVIVKAQGTDVRGIPMPTQTIMFITNSFLPEERKKKNIFYITPGKEGEIPENSSTFTLD